MTEKYVDIDLTDIGWVRLYISEEDYEDYLGIEILDMLNNQHETIQNLNQRIDDYLTEVNYQLEQGTDFKDTYVRYSRFKQILEELKGVLNND